MELQLHLLPLFTKSWDTAQAAQRQDEEVFNRTTIVQTLCFFRSEDAPNQSLVRALFHCGVHLKIVGYGGGEAECLAT